MVCVGRTTFPMPSERRKGGIFPKRSGRNNFGRPFIIYASALLVLEVNFFSIKIMLHTQILYQLRNTFNGTG